MSEFAEARRLVTGASWLDDLARASLFAAETKFDRLPPEPVLRVDIGAHVDAVIHARVTNAIQDATARIGHYLADPKTDGTRVTDEDRRSAPLYPRRQVGRTIEFGFVDLDQPETAPTLELPDPITRSEVAARELVEVLPAAVSDDQTLDALLGNRRPILNAVNDIAMAVESTAELGLEIDGGGREHVESVVTREQSRVIIDALRESSERRGTDVFRGRLDGLRTRRRIFFLETDAGDIQGAYDADIVGQVLAHVDRPVVATIEVVQRETRAGRRGSRSYRLLRLEDDPSLFDELA